MVSTIWMENIINAILYNPKNILQVIYLNLQKPSCLSLSLLLSGSCCDKSTGGNETKLQILMYHTVAPYCIFQVSWDSMNTNSNYWCKIRIMQSFVKTLLENLNHHWAQKMHYHSVWPPLPQIYWGVCRKMIHPSLLYITHLIFPVFYLFILNDYPLIFMVLHKSVLMDNVTTKLS